MRETKRAQPKPGMIQVRKGKAHPQQAAKPFRKWRPDFQRQSLSELWTTKLSRSKATLSKPEIWVGIDSAHLANRGGGPKTALTGAAIFG
jgi:hypothetical protein